MKKLLTVLFVSTLMVFAGCEKEGPEGPAGPQGPQGNANVQTIVFDVDVTDWSQTGTTLTYIHPTNLLSKNVVDNGIVHVYLEGTRNQEPTWIELPYFLGGNSVINFWLHEDELELTATDVTFNGTATFRMIAVEGNLQSTANIDFSNYEEVKHHFGLAD